MGIQVQPCCCGGCDCEVCTDETEEYTAELFSFTNNDCTDCTDLNAEFLLTRDTEGLCATGEAYEDYPCCCWSYYFPDSEPCGAYRLTLVFTSDTTASLVLESDPDLPDYWAFEYTLTPPDTCNLNPGVTTSAPLITGSPPCLGIVSSGLVASV